MKQARPIGTIDTGLTGRESCLFELLSELFELFFAAFDFGRERVDLLFQTFDLSIRPSRWS